MALLTAEVDRLINDEGYRSEDSVLAGHSAGAWTSLMALSKRKGLAKGVIAFAPSCCGLESERRGSSVWQKARNKQVREILGGASFRALTFSYDDDEYENTPHLQFLSARGRIVASNCGHGHRTYKRDCEAEETVRQITDFLK